MKILKCFNCGKNFIAGNNPQTGLPNGIGMKMNSGKTYDVCAKCMSYKTNEVHRKIMETENMPTKKIGAMVVPENFDVEGYEKLLVELGKDSNFDKFLTYAEEGGKTAFRETMNNVESLGIKLDPVKKKGLVIQFSSAQAEYLWNKIKDKSDDQIISEIAHVFMRYYYSIAETVEAENAALGLEN